MDRERATGHPSSEKWLQKYEQCATIAVNKVFEGSVASATDAPRASSCPLIVGQHPRCILRLALDLPIRCNVNPPQIGRESRQPGERPPVSRLIKAPVEQVMLSAVGFERIMNLAGELVRKPSLNVLIGR